MAEKMRYENEIENAKVDDEFNNSEEDLSAEDIYRVYMEEIAAIPPCSEAENAKLLGEIRNGNKALCSSFRITSTKVFRWRT